MKGRSHLLARKGIWTLLLVVVVVAGHGVVLYYGSSHVKLSAAVLSGAIILGVIKHLGLLGPVDALFRRRGPRSGS